MDRQRNFGFLIKDIARLHTKLFEQRAAHLGVTLAQCKVLVYVSRNEGISQIRLAELTGIEPMSLVRILDRMESDDWIERRADPNDRRARQLYLKEKAQPTMNLFWKESDVVRAQAFSDFTAGQRNQLMDYLERAHANLLAAASESATGGACLPESVQVHGTPTQRAPRAEAASIRTRSASGRARSRSRKSSRSAR
jgi:DNA-binding MarR family transcriptional regulator